MNTRKTAERARGFARAGGRAVIMGALGFALAGAVTGCRSIRQSDPPRTATEELLISSAADRAMTNEDFSWIKGKTVFVEDKYFESYDKGYAVSLIRQCLSTGGGLLMSSNTAVDFIVEIRSGALSINSSETLFGIPATTAPLPLTGAIALPEVAIYKSTREDSFSKFALFVYERESGAPVRAVGPLSSGAYLHFYKLLFLGWKRTDVPMLKHPPELHPVK